MAHAIVESGRSAGLIARQCKHVVGELIEGRVQETTHAHDSHSVGEPLDTLLVGRGAIHDFLDGRGRPLQAIPYEQLQLRQQGIDGGRALLGGIPSIGSSGF